VSPTALECAEHYFGGDYVNIPNGVDVARFHPDNEPFPESRSNDRVNVLFVGRLDPRKGVDLLIGAVPEVVRQTGGRARFIVVGDSYLRSRYEASVAADMRQHVTFVGAASAADLPRWFATADVFVSPATGNESFGIVLLEAMASGCPIVCSDIPGYRAAVDSNAVFHPPRDTGALADAVASLVLDERRRDAHAVAGRKRALEFAWPNVTERIESVYRTVLGVPVLSAARSAA
jgi:phosphatidylinositol alpha-mannosyltransferase